MSSTGSDGYTEAPAGPRPTGPAEGADGDGIVDVRASLDHPLVRELLALAFHRPTEADLDAVVAMIRDGAGVALGWLDQGRLVAVATGRPGGYGEATSCFVAVAPDHRRRGIAGRLVRAVADDLGVRRLVDTTDGEAVGFWRAQGAALAPLPDDRFRFVLDLDAPRAADAPLDPPWFAAPRIDHRGDRDVAVELPPEGNTLPLVPAPLRDLHVPPFVLEWVLAAAEVGQLLQHLLPGSLPPTTPPAELRTPWHELIGPVRIPLGADGDPHAAPGTVPALPVGVRIPVGALELV
ncbi:MAG TPA: GNAT family N-acetyltransferase, partial [Acidimicrobiales bacterium]|nr:GNAT family N-acetyltransferase [Acidimicrobiales bacterium]